MRAIYPGSFDPVTFGHLDIICRSSKIADELIIGVLKNNAKSPLFSLEERVRMLEEVTKDYHNVKVVPFEGLLVDFAKNMKADIVVRDCGRSQTSSMSFRWRRPITSWKRMLRRYSFHQTGILLI